MSSAVPPTHLVLADAPGRQRFRDLQHTVETLRDAIFDLDLHLAHLRDELAAFESHYNHQLAIEHHALHRLEALIRHIERWGDILHHQARTAVVHQARASDTKRAQELQRIRQQRERILSKAALPPAPKKTTKTSVQQELKNAYRNLARRYHPDLAQSETDRLHYSQVMTRINALYHAGDLEKLLVLQTDSQALLQNADESPATQEKQLQEKLAWLERVYSDLQHDQRAITQSETHTLWQLFQVKPDLIEILRNDLQQRAAALYDDVRLAIERLENEVRNFNRDESMLKSLDSQLQHTFDPFSDKQLARIGLQRIQVTSSSPAAKAQADWLVSICNNQPGVVRLVLLTYVAEMSTQPLESLETWNDLSLRFASLAAADATPIRIEQALAEADELLEFGVQHANIKGVRLGLRFRADVMREAVPVALERLSVRRLFKEILGVLGEHLPCKRCRRDVFAVPLYQTRGLDDLRASVCPHCHQTLQSYWMPKGKDIQAILNPSFIDYDLIEEWTFQFPQITVATQVTPDNPNINSVGHLKARLLQDVFTRHDVSLELKHLQIFQDGKKVNDYRQLRDFDNRVFQVALAEESPIKLNDALELVQHRIRTRFKAS